MSGGGGQGSTSSPPQSPSWLLPLELTGATSLESALLGGQIPSLTGLYSGVPQQGVPNLTSGQMGDIGGIQGLAGTGGQIPYQSQIAGNYGAIASPQAEQQYYKQFAAPEIMQQAALAGQGTSGAADQALAQGAIPYALQAQNTELQANQALQGLGQGQVQNQQNELASALQAQGLPYEVAQQLAQSQYNQAQQQWQYGKELQTFPFSLFGQNIGGGTTVQTGGKF